MFARFLPLHPVRKKHRRGGAQLPVSLKTLAERRFPETEVINE